MYKISRYHQSSEFYKKKRFFLTDFNSNADIWFDKDLSNNSKTELLQIASLIGLNHQQKITTNQLVNLISSNIFFE